MRPFDDIRILDFSRQAPGPFATMVLSDFGADVIAVEPPPGVADQPRNPYTARAIKNRRHEAIYRNKRSIILDLKQTAGREVALRLAREVDVVVEGFRPGVVDRLGIGWEALRVANPRLIYCSVSGYGQDGPDRLTAGHDIDYLARSGALSLFARPGGAPVPPLNILGDYAGGGLLAAFSIAAALAARGRTGEGQYIDVSMTDGVAYLMAVVFGDYFAGRRGPVKSMQAYSGDALPYYTTYQSRDGRWFAVGSEEPHFWRALCECLRRPDLLPLQHDGGRREWVLAELKREFGSRTAAGVRRIFRGRDVCVELALTPGEAVGSDLFRERGLVVGLGSPDGSTVRAINAAPAMSATPGRPRFAAPLPGEQTLAILGELGYPDPEVSALLGTGAALAR